MKKYEIEVTYNGQSSIIESRESILKLIYIITHTQ